MDGRNGLASVIEIGGSNLYELGTRNDTLKPSLFKKSIHSMHRKRFH